MDDFKESTLKLDREPQQIVVSDHFLNSCVHFDGSVRIIFSERVVPGVYILKELEVVLTCIRVVLIFLMLATL